MTTGELLLVAMLVLTNDDEAAIDTAEVDGETDVEGASTAVRFLPAIGTMPCEFGADISFS